MNCDYCQRPVVTDSAGRCVNCGAQHRVVRASEPRLSDPSVSLDEYIQRTGSGWKYGALMGGISGFAFAARMFKW